MNMRRSRFFGLGFTLIFFILACNLPLSQSTSADDQPLVKAPVVALAIDLDGRSPAVYLFVGHSSDDPWGLPAGNFYIEAAGEHDLVYTIGRAAIPQPGGDAELGKMMATAGGTADPQRNQELLLVANAIAGIKGGEWRYLEQSSSGFSTQFFDPQMVWTPAAIRAVREQYDPLLDKEEETMQAIMALEQRARETPQVKTCPGVCMPDNGILDTFLSFFVSMSVVDQHAVEDILAGSAAMTPEEKAEAFQYFPPSLTGGAQTFDQMLQNLQNGNLDKYAPTRIRNLLMDEPSFVEALTDIRKTNRPLLQIAHDEGAVLIEKGAEMEVEIVKQVLQAAFPGIEAGFDYADKVNALAEFIRTTYTDPAQGVTELAAGQAASQIAGQIKNGLLDMGYGEDLAAEMADYLSEEIVGQIAEQDPELEALMTEEALAAAPDNPDEQPTTGNQESGPDSAADCLAGRSQYSWGIEDIERHDCQDTSRCTGCGGIFYVQNNSNEVLYFTHYYYDSFQIPVSEGWKPGMLALQPGDRFERDVSLRNEWKKGETYYSEVTRILLVRDDPACLDLSQDFIEAHAVMVERISCE